MIQKVLFICHEANRTGAPLLLLQFLKWLKCNRDDIHFDVLLLKTGLLSCEFESLSNVYYYKTPSTFKPSLWVRIMSKFLPINVSSSARYRQELIFKIKSIGYNVIYGNTITTCGILNELSENLPNCKLLLHVHELADLTPIYDDQLQILLKKQIHIIAVSEMTKMNLVNRHQVPQAKISLIYEYVNINEILKVSTKKMNHPKSFLIQASGTIQPRKGYDLFFQLALITKKKFPEAPFLFRWIGPIPQDYTFLIANDIELLGLTNYLEFAGGFDDPYPEYSESDVFVLTSRQDPFPLVCLEHACLGKPIICFDKVTGMTEFIKNDVGFVVPYMDIEQMSDRIYELYINPELYKQMSSCAAEKAKSYDVNIQAPKILSTFI